jgi:hypothetical protein
LSDDERHRLLDDTITLLLARDPGKTYLNTLTDGKRFCAYSASQRRKESGARRNRVDMKRALNTPVASGFGHACTYQELQDSTSEGKSKSCFYSRFAEYQVARLGAAPALQHLYGRIEFRRANYRAFLGYQSSEAKLKTE